MERIEEGARRREAIVAALRGQTNYCMACSTSGILDQTLLVHWDETSHPNGSITGVIYWICSECEAKWKKANKVDMT